MLSGVWAPGAARAFDPETFDVDQFIESLQTRQSITLEMARIARHWGRLSREARSKLGRYYLPEPLVRPADPRLAFSRSAASETVQGARTLIVGHCRIIWGADYAAKVNKTSAYYTYWLDPDQDGFPTYIEKLAGSDPDDKNDPSVKADFSKGICETVWSLQVAAMGFNRPAGSEDYYIDVYIADTGVVNTAVDTNQPGQGITLPKNIHGIAFFYQSGAPYIVLNHDMNLNTLKVTFAHEFFHAIQFSYLPIDDLLQGGNYWLAESSAVWMEDAVYPLVNDYRQYVNYWVNLPHRSLFSSDQNFRYGGVLFLKYLTENFHQPDDPVGSRVIRSIWEHTSRTKDPRKAIHSFLKEQTVNAVQDFDDAFTGFALKNLDIQNAYVDGSLFYPVYRVRKFAMDTLPETWHADRVDDYTYLPGYYGTNYIRFVLKDNDLNALANRLVFNFQGQGSLASGTQPRWRVFIVPEGEDGALHSPVPLALENATQGVFIKKDHTLFTAVNVVVVILPGSDQAFDAETKFVYNYDANSYVATRFTGGWNLVNVPSDGKGELEAIRTSLTSAWRWDSDRQGWQVNFPNETDEFTALYISAKGFARLSGFGMDDGVWILSRQEGLEVEFSRSLSDRSLSLKPGWNLAGISALEAFDVTALENSPWCKSVWKYESSQKVWQVYIPEVDDAFLQDYINGRRLVKLEKIYYGEGFWINSTESAELMINPAR
ncbi:MAG: DUF6055 domain-containing protein [Desulfobacterales bacterium]|nr:DUF6055 domain-containing protein [Desulfobacterales bacterium]